MDIINGQSYVSWDYKNDNVMNGSVLIGCHHGLEKKHLNYIEEVFSEFLMNY